MGNYLEVSTLVARIGGTEIDNLCRSITGVPRQDAFLDDVIDRAEGVVNGFAGKIYEIPMPKSAVLEELAARFAEFELYKRASADDVPTKYKIGEDTWKMLDGMGNGSFVPPGAEPRTYEGMSIDADSDDALMSEDAFGELSTSSADCCCWW